MSSPLRLALAAALAASASAAGKCAFQHSATRAWSVDAAKNTSALCTGTGYQWIGGYKQESYGSPIAPKRKTWWTKRLVVGETRLYFGGPPTERDMKMLYGQGFDAVYSVVHAASTTSTFTGNDLEGNTKLTASSAESKAKAIGLLYGINDQTDFKNQASLDDYVRFIDFAKNQTDGPIYVHCAFGGASSTALQMYRLSKATLAKTAAGIDQAITEVGYHGIDISAHVAGLALASGATKSATLPTVEAGELIKDYHWAKYLGKLGNTQFYDAGQIHENHINIIKTKVAAVVNMRKSATIGGIETTNLLNMHNMGGDASGSTRHNATYVQLPANTQFIIDSTRADPYAGPASQNFESINVLEFGDAAGYNASDEGVQMIAASLTYKHLPVGGSCTACKGYSKETLVAYATEMIEAINAARATNKHVLFHCRTGYRTGAFPSLLLGVMSGSSGADMTTRMKNVGYDFDLTDGGKVQTLFNTVSDLEFTGYINPDNTSAINGTVQAKPVQPVVEGPKTSSANVVLPTVMTAAVLALVTA